MMTKADSILVYGQAGAPRHAMSGLGADFKARSEQSECHRQWIDRQPGRVVTRSAGEFLKRACSEDVTLLTVKSRH